MKRAGFLSIEALVVGVLLLLCLQASWTVVSVQLGAARNVAVGAEILDATRIARSVIGGEVARGLPNLDWTLEDGEVRLRAFRGLGTVCLSSVPGEVIVQVKGFRNPDPRKDSLVVLDGSGHWHLRRLVGRRRTGRVCAARPSGSQWSAERWILSEPVVEPLLLMYFERGSYRFSDASLRYRVGRGGWQPLLPVLMETDSSLLGTTDQDALRVQVMWAQDGVGRRVWDWTIWPRDR